MLPITAEEGKLILLRKFCLNPWNRKIIVYYLNYIYIKYILYRYLMYKSLLSFLTQQYPFGKKERICIIPLMIIDYYLPIPWN